MGMRAKSPAIGNAKGRANYKLSMLMDLLAKAVKQDLPVCLALYAGELWYVYGTQYLCPALACYDDYCYACKVLRPEIRAAKHAKVLETLKSIEQADLFKALKSLGYKIQ